MLISNMTDQCILSKQSNTGGRLKWNARFIWIWALKFVVFEKQLQTQYCKQCLTYNVCSKS